MTGKEIIMLIRTEPAIGHRKLFDEYKNYIYAIAYNRLRSVASKEDTIFTLTKTNHILMYGADQA